MHDGRVSTFPFKKHSTNIHVDGFKVLFERERIVANNEGERNFS